jgi:hypothetical protein
VRGDHDASALTSKTKKKSVDGESQSSSRSSSKGKKKKKKGDEVSDKKKDKKPSKPTREIEVVKATAVPVFKTDKKPSWATARTMLKTVPAPFSDAALALLAERRAKPPSSDEEEPVQALTVNTSAPVRRRSHRSSSSSPHSSKYADERAENRLNPTYPTTSRPSIRKSSVDGSTGGKDDRRYVRALYDFEGGQPGDLRLREGDIIQILGQVDANWWQGKCHGKVGMFPTAFVSKKQLRKRDKSSSGRSGRSSSSRYGFCLLLFAFGWFSFWMSFGTRMSMG